MNRRSKKMMHLSRDREAGLEIPVEQPVHGDLGRKTMAIGGGEEGRGREVEVSHGEVK